jgi:nucleoporin NUP159
LKTGELKKSSGVTRQKADLDDPRELIFGDIEEFGRVLVDVQVDVKELKLQRVSLRKAMKELDSNILKGRFSQGCSYQLDLMISSEH